MFRTLLRLLKPRDSRAPIQNARRKPSHCRFSIETLEDRAVPAAVLSISGASIVEGNDGSALARVVVSLSEPHASNVTVNYATANSTATAGSDYDAVSGMLTFAKGQTTKTILIPVRGDRIAEPTESFRVQLSNVTKGAKIANATASVDIMDDEPRISVSDRYASEGNNGTTEFTFTVSLSSPSDLPVTVHYATTDGTASAGDDYTSAGTPLFYAPNQTSQDITVLVHGDRLPEGNETFLVTLSAPSDSAVLGKAVGVGVILDDDPLISITEAYNYGDYSPFVFTVSLSAASTETVTVDFTTADGWAVAGVDYVFTSGTLTFAPGVTSMNIFVDVLDPTYADNKYFAVQLSNATSNALIGNETAFGYWYNYDDYYSFYGGW